MTQKHTGTPFRNTTTSLKHELYLTLSCYQKVNAWTCKVSGDVIEDAIVYLLGLDEHWFLKTLGFILVRQEKLEKEPYARLDHLILTLVSRLKYDQSFESDNWELLDSYRELSTGSYDDLQKAIAIKKQIAIECYKEDLDG